MPDDDHVDRNASQFLVSFNECNYNELSIGQLLRFITPDRRNLVRKIEKLNKKDVSLKYGVIYCETCIKEGLLPKFTNIRTFDPEARDKYFTVEYRKKLIEYERDKNLQTSEEIQKDLQDSYIQFIAMMINPNLKRAIGNRLNHLKENYESNVLKRTQRKLNDLYGGTILIKNKLQSYLNLSDHRLSANQIQLLELGPKFAFKPRFCHNSKKIELEILYESLLNLRNRDIISISDSLKPQLIAESTKRRDFKPSSVLTKELISAAKELKLNPNIVVRKATDDDYA